MHQVSKAYAESMKSSLRERAYIRLTFGLINQEAQTNAEMVANDLTPYSSLNNMFGERVENVNYATLEENFLPVDGSMYFLPRDLSAYSIKDVGLVSNDLIVDNTFSVNVSLHIPPIDFKGLTIDFGDNCPSDFDIVTDGGQTVQVRGNTKGLFVTEEVFENTSGITLIVYAMKYPQNRLRIFSMQFGYGLTYRNDSVMSSSLESYISPIGEELPQIDFTVTVKNYNKYFDVDNPDSAIHFFETGQAMDIDYGYQLPDGEIEWVKGNHLLCAEWEADDHTATIRCQDVFRNMDTEFNLGVYSASGKSFYDLAVEVLTVGGVEEYQLDNRLKSLYTKNPIPRVKCKEALQIIANACRCTLSQSREGVVEIKADGDVTDFVMEKMDMTTHPKAIKTEVVKEVVIPCYSYQTGGEDERLLEEEVTVSAGESVTFYLNDASYGYTPTAGTVVASGCYYVTLQFSSSGTYKVEVRGHRYKITERQVAVTLRERGKSVRWENPLVSDMEVASELAQWMAGYYTASVEYEYSTRGNPEIDASDVIYQENEFREGMQVMVYRTKLNFNQAFSGEISARRLGV